MSDGERFRDKAQTMRRMATMALTPLERRSYVDLATAWDELAKQALALEAKAGILGEAVEPFIGRFLTDPDSESDPEP